MKKGGFICFHDYQSSWEGVKRAVDEYLAPGQPLQITDSMAVIQRI